MVAYVDRNKFKKRRVYLLNRNYQKCGYFQTLFHTIKHTKLANKVVKETYIYTNQITDKNYSRCLNHI